MEGSHPSSVVSPSGCIALQSVERWVWHLVNEGQCCPFSPAVMYGCESWTRKKAEHQRMDVFKLWCWRRLLRVPWTAEIKPVNSKGSQPLIFIGRTDAKTEALILQSPDGKS